MKNFRLIQAVYIPQTNTRGARVKLTDLRRKESTYITNLWSYDSDDAGDIAIEYLSKKGFTFIGKGNADKGYCLITENFESTIK
ncbi:hypothetical protein E6Q11_04855 [Candidatus Dojkabacteria bacterium]|uniref:Uncharacterized protein n=1 Tax=Candidatus Dojkabacteria bacterium TaxID=2099670 RepID=A0A5C7J589_9BACT|nr:MAG: hypothetical protein E6Q11_04855 [Candidatus Dojkabacteria bacterium]